MYRPPEHKPPRGCREDCEVRFRLQNYARKVLPLLTDLRGR
jgi:hypothetical protein